MTYTYPHYLTSTPIPPIRCYTVEASCPFCYKKCDVHLYGFTKAVLHCSCGIEYTIVIKPTEL